MSVRRLHEDALTQLLKNREKGVRELYPHQEDFIGRFTEYLRAVVESRHAYVEVLQGPPMARIEAAPRTGKTTVAAEIIRRTDLKSLYFVPTENLRTQAAREMSALLPGKKVMIYDTTRKELEEADVTVASYQIGQAAVRSDKGLPSQLRSTPLIFADEGHESTSEKRNKMIREEFDQDSLRIALSGTPDYSSDRRLAHFYPDLIHSITMPEAVNLGLLSKFEYWVYTIDLDASTVDFVAGDYRDDKIAQVMSGLPIFKTMQILRYHAGDSEHEDRVPNKDIPALICFRTKQQAYDALAYLQAALPDEANRAAVVTEDTRKRQKVLDAYEAGEYDTLIGVRAIITGWDSQRCKLLLDFDPSAAPVKSGQKYTRPLTKSNPGDERIARIYSVLPTGLRFNPILPPDVLTSNEGPELPSGHACGSSEKNRQKTSDPIRILPADIGGLEIKPVMDLKEYGGMSSLKLDKNDTRLIKAIVASGAANDETFESEEIWLTNILRSYRNFQGAFFNHPSFVGFGRLLLWALDISSSEQFKDFVMRVFPEQHGTSILIEDSKGFNLASLAVRKKAIKDEVEVVTIEEDVANLLGAISEKPNPDARTALYAFFGSHFSDEERPDPILLKQIMRCMDILDDRKREILRKRIIEGEEVDKIGQDFGICAVRVRDICMNAIEEIRAQLILRYPLGSEALKDMSELLKVPAPKYTSYQEKQEERYQEQKKQLFDRFSDFAAILISGDTSLSWNNFKVENMNDEERGILDEILKKWFDVLLKELSPTQVKLAYDRMVLGQISYRQLPKSSGWDICDKIVGSAVIEFRSTWFQRRQNSRLQAGS